MGRSQINARLGMKSDYGLEDAQVRSRQGAAIWGVGLGIVRPRGQVYRLEKL
jgi:hypothetical protein